MDGWRIRTVAGIAGFLLSSGVAGCASPTDQSSAAAHTGGTSGANRSPSVGAGGVLAPTPAALPDLAPAGPAPGGTSPVDEGEEQPTVAALAAAVGCVELEPQTHVPSVDEQVSCRRGTERAYLLTFRSTADRDVYLTRGPQVVTGGFTVIAATCVVHVASEGTARAFATRLRGVVRAGPPNAPR